MEFTPSTVDDFVAAEASILNSLQHLSIFSPLNPKDFQTARSVENLLPNQAKIYLGRCPGVTYGSSGRSLLDKLDKSSTTLERRVHVPRHQSTCFASRRDSSKPSISSFHFSLFTITWGICFSLES